MSAQAMIRRFSKNMAGRDFVVGDVHGAFTRLQRSLDAIGFDREADRLFSVGDLVDRGDESAQVVEWLDQAWFHAVYGNHDLLAWRSALGMPFHGVVHEKHGGRWLRELPSEARIRIGERLFALPIVLEIETSHGMVGVVHADFPGDDWQDVHSIDWRRLDEMNSPAGQCLWSIERYRRNYAGPVRNIRAVVHGHLCIPEPRILGNSFFIDTGGWDDGAFTFLELEDLRWHVGPSYSTAAILRDHDGARK